ncbi:hypothetical protein BHE74_00044441 [Ensete ventricosum]|nr:hypothetical protein GW17_00035339 [Ensete ventricosum]RWW49422.1 hypothetical protein BHE74_00044441 [Ensete ventricosum]
MMSINADLRRELTTSALIGCRISPTLRCKSTHVQITSDTRQMPTSPRQGQPEVPTRRSTYCMTNSGRLTAQLNGRDAVRGSRNLGKPRPRCRQAL